MASRLSTRTQKSETRMRPRGPPDYHRGRIEDYGNSMKVLSRADRHDRPVIDLPNDKVRREKAD